MKEHKKYMPYVRLMTGKEKSGHFAVASRLALLQVTRINKGLTAYVLIQRGLKDPVWASKTKVELQKISKAVRQKVLKDRQLQPI